MTFHAPNTQPSPFPQRSGAPCVKPTLKEVETLDTPSLQSRSPQSPHCDLSAIRFSFPVILLVEVVSPCFFKPSISQPLVVLPALCPQLKLFQFSRPIFLVTDRSWLPPSSFTRPQILTPPSPSGRRLAQLSAARVVLNLRNRSRRGVSGNPDFSGTAVTVHFFPAPRFRREQPLFGMPPELNGLPQPRLSQPCLKALLSGEDVHLLTRLLPHAMAGSDFFFLFAAEDLCGGFENLPPCAAVHAVPHFRPLRVKRQFRRAGLMISCCLGPPMAGPPVFPFSGRDQHPTIVFFVSPFLLAGKSPIGYRSLGTNDWLTVTSFLIPKINATLRLAIFTRPRRVAHVWST